MGHPGNMVSRVYLVNKAPLALEELEENRVPKDLPVQMAIAGAPEVTALKAKKARKVPRDGLEVRENEVRAVTLEFPDQKDQKGRLDIKAKREREDSKEKRV